MDNTVQEWLKTAETDLGVAQHLFEHYHPKPIEIVCYHCQQSAEKAIKAVIISYGAPGGMPKLHDLSFLLNQVKNLVCVDDSLYDYADTLTPLWGFCAIPERAFPGGTSCCGSAWPNAAEILSWAKANCKSDQ